MERGIETERTRDSERQRDRSIERIIEKERERDSERPRDKQR